jgi:hypothetical protein
VRRPLTSPGGGPSEATIYNWKAKYGGLEVSDAKQLLAEALLDYAGLKELPTKVYGPRIKARSDRMSPGISGDERAVGLSRYRR